MHFFSDQILDGVNPEEEKKKKEGEEKSAQPKSREEVIDETVAQCKLNEEHQILTVMWKRMKKSRIVFLGPSQEKC